jgi:uncharacterized protein (TIGR03437 family)
VRSRRVRGVFLRLGWVFGLMASILPAQPVATGAGYSFPRLIEVAPGQVITLFVRVPGKEALAAPVTAQPPLPATLSGFAVILRQSFPSDPVAVPIQSVADSQFCSAVAPSQCDVVSLLTVQVPFELTPNVPGSRMPENSARLEITYNNATATSLFLRPVTDRIHVLNTCDVLASFPEGNCAPLVTHADGGLVDIEHPAAEGETLMVALAGMGRPNAPVSTGAASPNPPVAVDNVWLTSDIRPNLPPVMPDPDFGASAATARLRSGSAGLYDVLFTVPALPNGTPPCSSAVRSNLTLSIGRTTSHDGAGICVARPAL